jgi:negative regulator of flagellin synthesis FlgM
VAAAAPVRSVEGATQAVTTSAAASLTQSAAASAPVDAERVARIKKAIADGNFPLVPSTIADRLLALKLQWNPNDAA